MSSVHSIFIANRDVQGWFHSDHLLSGFTIRLWALNRWTEQMEGCCEGSDGWMSITQTLVLYSAGEMVVMSHFSNYLIRREIWTLLMDLSWCGIPQMSWTVQTTSSFIFLSWPPGLNCDLVLSSHLSAPSLTQLPTCTATKTGGVIWWLNERYLIYSL